MSWTLSTSGAAIAKAGANANSAIIASAATLAKWSDEAEGTLCTATRKDWVADYALITTNFKPILDDTISSMVALNIINYDMSGYTSRAEALTMLNVVYDKIIKNIATLQEQDRQEVMD
jgi:hypothetical protein